MSSSVYDPRKFEFVARMGRIPAPSVERKKEKIPVTFRIPDPPEQELVSIPLGRSMRAEPMGGSVNTKPPNMDDFLLDLPAHINNERKHSEEERKRKNDLLEKMVKARRERDEERKLEQHAQQLVNEALLQNELKEMRKREGMLKDVTTDLNGKGLGKYGSADMTNATIFEKGEHNVVDDDLMKQIRKELERLGPIVPGPKD